MTRMSKQGKKRAQYPKKRHYPSPKTGSLKDNLELGYKPHENAVSQKENSSIFIAKVK